MAINKRIGQAAYGMLFVIFLPGLGYLWARRLDQIMPHLWPIPVPEWIGIVLTTAGATLMLASMAILWVIGKGLPMNAYPPAHFVHTGPYALFSHPIYLSFISVVVGLSIAAPTPAGFWIIGPLSVLAVLALLLGYERPRLMARFSEAGAHIPIFGLPPADTRSAPLHRRLAALAITLGPWSIAYMLFSAVPAPSDSLNLRMDWENSVALRGWAVWPYSAAYAFSMLGPLLLRSNVSLRRFVIGGWLMTLIGFSTMLCFHGRAELLAASSNGIEAALLGANRMFDADWLALPSFHVAWTVLAAYCLVERQASYRLISVAFVGVVGLSCVLTGSHAVVDITAGLILGILSWHHKEVWLAIVRWAERMANSWSAISLGPIRVINHAFWSWLAAFAGMSVVVILAGPELLVEAAGVFLIGIVAAGAWGYWLEGGSRLSRPFGYYGFLYGGLFALLVLAVIDKQSAGRLAVAFACGAPVAQAIGRVRCLIQGCCHGRPVTHSSGIHVTNAKSRVTALSNLHGIAIHPTQLYSIVFNIAIFVCMAGLCISGTSATFVAGLYLVLSSLARFVEEEYRGEAQTPRYFGLAIYQWLSISNLLLGIAISMFDGAKSSVPEIVSGELLVFAFSAGVVAALLMSVDLPRSKRRFSRLTVGEMEEASSALT